MAQLETDYLVAGSGGCGMAFVDTLLTETDAKVVMVDRHARPGGHWNEAYPFVKLHQPSAWYGVASRELGSWTHETDGPNAGLLGLASGEQVMDHFNRVMDERFLASGRVQWFPKSEHVTIDGKTHGVRSLASGHEQTIVVRRKFVNATHAKTEVPSTHPPTYSVAPGVQCVPPNSLPQVSCTYDRYTVVGSGKTGMDACLWLLEHNVPASRIRWIRPRDAWLFDRANMQPGPDGCQRFFDTNIAQFDAIASSSNPSQLFQLLEERGVFMRIDPDVEPTTFRCAIVSRGELKLLQSITDVVRLGRVRAVEPTKIVLAGGALEAHPHTLYINCSASAIQPTPNVRVFEGDSTINILMVRMCQPLFSAAVIAWVEAHIQGSDEKNLMCRPVRGPELPIDFVRMWATTLQNVARWSQHAELQKWLGQCRLNGQAVALKGVEITPLVKELLGRVREGAGLAGAKLPALIAQIADH
jgi:hypothetical protein